MRRTVFNKQIDFGRFHCLQNKGLLIHVYIGWSPSGYYVREAVPVSDKMPHECRFPEFPFRFMQKDIDQVEKLVAIHREFNPPLPELIKVGEVISRSIESIPRVAKK